MTTLTPGNLAKSNPFRTASLAFSHITLGRGTPHLNAIQPKIIIRDEIFFIISIVNNNFVFFITPTTLGWDNHKPLAEQFAYRFLPI